MYIKVECDLIETAVYQFDGTELFIGSSPANNLVLNFPSISKFHLKIFSEEGRYFASDMGSTNGSYLVDQKLKRDKKVELLGGESIRLGDMVHVTLLDEAEGALALPPADLEVIKAETSPSTAAAPKAEDEKTRVVSLTALEKAKIVSAKKRQEELKKKKVQEAKRKKEESKSTSKVLMIGLAVIALGWVGNKWWVARRSKVASSTIIKTMQGKASGDMEIEADLEGHRISRGALVKRTQLAKMLPLPKCNQEETKVFCEENPLYDIKGSGVLFEAPNTYFFFVLEQGYLSNVKLLLKPEEKLSDDSLSKFAFLHFYQVHVSEREVPGDAQIYVIFYNVDQQDLMSVSAVSALRQAAAINIKNLLSEFKFPGPFEDTESVLKKFDVYYTNY